MARRIGFLGKAYYNATADVNPATEITTLVEATPDFSAGEISANDRANPDWEIVLRGRKAGSVGMTLNYDDTDPDGFLAALYTAFDSTDPTVQLISLKFLSHTSGKGYYGTFRIMNVSRPEPGDGIMTVSVQCRYQSGFTRV
mgnify:CR=1 FL=1